MPWKGKRRAEGAILPQMCEQLRTGEHQCPCSRVTPHCLHPGGGKVMVFPWWLSPSPRKLKETSSVSLYATFPLSRLCLYRAPLGKSRSSFTLELPQCLPPPQRSPWRGPDVIPTPSLCHPHGSRPSCSLGGRVTSLAGIFATHWEALKIVWCKNTTCHAERVSRKPSKEAGRGCQRLLGRSIGPWTGSQKNLNLHPSLDTMSYMTLDKSLNLPETWLYYLKSGSNVSYPAYLTGANDRIPKRTNKNTATVPTKGLDLEGLGLKQKFSFGTEEKSSETGI